MDAGGGGNLLLLKDSEGTLWTVDLRFFANGYSLNLPQYLFIAGYYKNGERLGSVSSFFHATN
jgi:hypothetical protein